MRAIISEYALYIIAIIAFSAFLLVMSFMRVNLKIMSTQFIQTISGVDSKYMEDR